MTTATTPTAEGSTALRVSSAMTEVVREGKDLRTRIDGLTIVDDASQKLAIETGSIITRLEKKVEAERVALTKPLNDELKLINEHFKRYLAPLDEMKKAVKAKLASYVEELERKRREEEERQRRILEEIRKKELEEAKAKGEEAPVALVLPAEEIVKTTHADTGAATATKRWTFEVTDATAIPREYLAVDEKKIREAIRAGVREVPGVRIYQDTNISFR